jgi:hypothetical protein
MYITKNNFVGKGVSDREETSAGKDNIIINLDQDSPMIQMDGELADTMACHDAHMSINLNNQPGDDTTEGEESVCMCRPTDRPTWII